MIPVHIDLGPDSLRVCAASGPVTPRDWECLTGQLWLTLHRPNNTPNERPLWLEVAEYGSGLALK